MTLKSGTGQACAACKYQRRRCTPECLLAPFFPADEPRMFQNVHRLFGVKNIQNLLKDLGPDEKIMAMKSIKFHANMRDKYPVYGCLVDIQQLTYQIQIAEEELQAVLQQLAYYRQQHQQETSSSPINEYFSELQLGVAPPGNVQLLHEDIPLPLVAPQVSCSNSDNVDYDINYLDLKDNNVVNSLCQQSNDNNNNNNSVIIPQTMPIQQGMPEVDYNEMHPLFDHFDDTQSYIGSKEAYESSLDSPLKDARKVAEEMDENELKSAAACFSLTSVN